MRSSAYDLPAPAAARSRILSHSAAALSAAERADVACCAAAILPSAAASWWRASSAVIAGLEKVIMARLVQVVDREAAGHRRRGRFRRIIIRADVKSLFVN